MHIYFNESCLQITKIDARALKRYLHSYQTKARRTINWEIYAYQKSGSDLMDERKGKEPCGSLEIMLPYVGKQSQFTRKNQLERPSFNQLNRGFIHHHQTLITLGSHFMSYCRLSCTSVSYVLSNDSSMPKNAQDRNFIVNTSGNQHCSILL